MHDTGCLGLVHWDDPEGWYGEGGGSGWGTRVYLWQIHVDIWQNQYNIVKLKKKRNIVDMQYYVLGVQQNDSQFLKFIF